MAMSRVRERVSINSVNGSDEIESVHGDEKKFNTAQTATAAGGSAINTSLFVQNSMQLKKLLSLQLCSAKYKKTKDDKLTCDPWEERNSLHKMTIIMIGVSFVLQITYGIGTLAEQYILRKLHAVEHDHDTEDEASKKKAKTIFLRTLTACDGFTIALLNIFLGVFVDSF